jgi:protein TonB
LLVLLVAGFVYVVVRNQDTDEPNMPVDEAPLSLKSDEDEGILHVSHTAPLFPGCEELAADVEAQKTCSESKLLKYVYGKIKYPQYALDHNIEGRCVITFVVETDGKISHAKILKDIGGGCGEEALRVVNTMNEMPLSWIPGKNDGKPVRVRFNLPVKFQLKTRPEN